MQAGVFEQKVGGLDAYGAGNASLCRIPSCPKAVHPRGCGERRYRVSVCLLLGGSSPRVRGTPAQTGVMPSRWRFIPAGAGNAYDWMIGSSPLPVHPRGCGERLGLMLIASAKSGSSPRVRGTPRASGAAINQRRFIPAGAGNASRGGGWTRRAPVHPRGCGERKPSCNLRRHVVGSSPRVRGTHYDLLLHPRYGRFIPAGAGNAVV